MRFLQRNFTIIKNSDCPTVLIQVKAVRPLWTINKRKSKMAYSKDLAIILVIILSNELGKMGKTKASCILNGSFAPHIQQPTVDIMKTVFYFLSTDGSNDTGLEKRNPLIVPLFDMQGWYAIAVYVLNHGQTSGTAATTFQRIDYVMTKFQFPCGVTVLVFHLMLQMKNWVFTKLLRPELFLKMRTLVFWHAMSYHT